MKQLFFLLVFILSNAVLIVSGQIKGVIVENYYVSDSLDATDTTGVAFLQPGSKTYRIYVELESGSRIRKIYGDSYHELKIASTADFYNNYDRPTAYFGYLINKSWFSDNPLLVLDSWITIGRCAKTSMGVQKNMDSDGSFIGGNNNNGGSAGIPGGILVNADSCIGLALTQADGFIPDTSVLSQWLDNGFKDLAGADTTIFGTINTGNCFTCNNCFLQQNSGVSGDSNRVLVAQVTTKGELTFKLNLEVEETDGSSTTIVKYVANGDTLLPGEKVSPVLTYPPLCGCKDARYLEYNDAYACENIDSCKTLIVYGCMDSLACNYDAGANFNIPALCCYPGLCNDRDLTIACPSLTQQRMQQLEFKLFPNPADDKLSLVIPLSEYRNLSFKIYNMVGQLLIDKDLQMQRGLISTEVSLEKLQSGLYVIQVQAGDLITVKKFFKQ